MSRLILCSSEFIEKHTPETQTEYLRKELSSGKQLFMLVDSYSIDIVRYKAIVLKTYMLQPDAQNCGYGTMLLKYAMKQCKGSLRLWVFEQQC